MFDGPQVSVRTSGSDPPEEGPLSLTGTYKLIRPVTVVMSDTRERSGTGAPNVLWITLEDTSPRLGCYGDNLAETPHIDRLATEGRRFTNAFATSWTALASCGLATGAHPRNCTTSKRTHTRSRISQTTRTIAGSWTDSAELSLICATEGASIRYAFGDGDWTLYTGPVQLESGETTVRATANRYGYADSDDVGLTFEVAGDE